MNKEQIAESVTSKLALSAEWSELERLRLIDVSLESHVNSINQDILSIAKRKGDVKTARFENFKLILACSQRIDELQGEITPAVSINLMPETLKKERTKKAAPETAPRETAKEKHPCHLCEDVFYHRVDLVKHLRINHGLSIEESVKPVPEGQKEKSDFLSLCADCLGECGEYPPSNTKAGCNRYRSTPDAVQIAHRDGICQEWRDCVHMEKCFGQANEEGDTDCLKGREIRAAARGKAPDVNARKAQLIAEKADRDSKCDKWMGCEHAIACFDPDKAALQGTYCLPSKTTVCWNSSCAWSDLAQPDHCDADDQFRQGRAVSECKCFINGIGPTAGQNGAECHDTTCGDNDPEVPGCCETWDDVLECPRVVTAGWGWAKENDESEVSSGNDALAPTDTEILARHEPAEAILPRGEFRTKDIPKGKKKRAEALEARRASVAHLVAHRIKLFQLGSAAISDYDKGMGYDLEFNLKQNKTQLGYALSQFNGLNEFLNPPTPTPAKEEPKQEVAQPVDESTAQASEVVQCRNNDCASFDSFCADNCSKLPIGEPESVTACKDHQDKWPQDREQPKPSVPDDCDDCGNRGILDGTDDYCNCPHGVRTRKADQAELERRKERKAELNAEPVQVVQVDELQPATFNPLDEPLGDCEQCMGYGVVEGELFGESSFIPCSCQAGKKVAGEKWEPARKKCCENCDIDDPDCSSCNLPDLEAGAPVEKPAPVIDKDRTCCMPPDRDWREDNGNRVLFCRVCHLIHRLTDMGGKDLPFEIGTKYNLVAKVEAPKPATLTPLQQKCTHPSVFRTPVEGGFFCKCCKQTILSGGGRRDCLPFNLEHPTDD